LPAVAAAEVTMVKLVVPLPGTSVTGEKKVVTPAGCPLTASARLVGNLPCGAVHVKRTFVACSRLNDSVAGVAVREHLATIAVTVKATLTV
jgi:hypothetical protein